MKIVIVIANRVIAKTAAAAGWVLVRLGVISDYGNWYNDY